jgi:hypothetical protein
MRVASMVRRICSGGSEVIHAKRLAALAAAVEGLTSSEKLSVTGIGRGFRTRTRPKHSIKRAHGRPNYQAADGASEPALSADGNRAVARLAVPFAARLLPNPRSPTHPRRDVAQLASIVADLRPDREKRTTRSSTASPSLRSATASRFLFTIERRAAGRPRRCPFEGDLRPDQSRQGSPGREGPSLARGHLPGCPVSWPRPGPSRPKHFFREEGPLPDVISVGRIAAGLPAHLRYERSAGASPASCAQ